MVSFTDEGEIVVWDGLSEGRLELMGLHGRLRLRWIDMEHLPFLQWHRGRYRF